MLSSDKFVEKPIYVIDSNTYKANDIQFQNGQRKLDSISMPSFQENINRKNISKETSS